MIDPAESNRCLHRKRVYTNLLMFVGLMAMAMVAWLDHQNRLPQRRPAQTSAPPNIEQLNFENAHGVAVKIQLSGGQWRIEQPVKILARHSRVERLLELASLDFEQGYDSDSVNLHAAGLGEHARVIRLGQQIYRFGSLEPLSANRYIQRHEKVIVVEDRYLPLMDGGINALAELKLPTQALESILLDNKPIAEELLASWRNTQAIGIRNASISDSSSVRNLELKSETTTHWKSWPEKGLWVLQAKNSGVQYLISAAQAATLGLD